jgi:hypothetical protein
LAPYGDFHLQLSGADLSVQLPEPGATVEQVVLGHAGHVGAYLASQDLSNERWPDALQQDVCVLAAEVAPADYLATLRDDHVPNLGALASLQHDGADQTLNVALEPDPGLLNNVAANANANLNQVAADSGGILDNAALNAQDLPD